MDFFKIIIGIVPLVVLFMTLSWEIDYYKQYIRRRRYWSLKAKMPMYLAMFFVGLLALLVMVPFIALAILWVPPAP